jgi:flagellar basal-body rod modification protein FlgD
VDAFNKSLADGKTTKLPNAAMDKNDFLKILITQLSHQDPTQPMQDKEFIAQMAQFSSLEQITNMSEGLAKVADLVARSQAQNLLGSAVDLADGESMVSGIVDAVTAGEYPQLLVNGKYYDFSQVQTIKRDVNQTARSAAESARGAGRAVSARAVGKE